jgi:hypothetical protein
MKAAIYIEVKGRTNRRLDGRIFPWAGYIYADKEVNPADYEYIKDSKDQWEKPVKVYKAKESTYFEYPGGLKKTDLVVLF